jgi:hypothetical protein
MVVTAMQASVIGGADAREQFDHYPPDRKPGCALIISKAR